MAYSPQTTGDPVLDKLLTDHHNAVFDCGDWRDIGEDPCYDDDRKFATYEEASAVAEQTRRALYAAIRERLAVGKETGQS